MDATTIPDTGQAQRPPERARLNTNGQPHEARQMSVTSTSGPNTPLSSAPATPSLKTPLSRRTSQPAISPSTATKPHLLQRTSSSASIGRPPSSPKLARKGSRSSLGGAADDDRRPTPKRSISNLIAGLREAHSTMESIEEPIPLTAPQIATEHFTRELLGHMNAEAEAETVVILHDACYGHRYSRLKTTKSTLSMIVERPERIHASILGASAAYVRLGGHHAGARHAPHPDRTNLSRPPFQIRRSARSLDITSSFVTNVHGTDWMGELKRMCHTAAEKLATGAKELTRAPLAGEPEKRKLHEGDLYLAPESLDAFQGALGGVADAVDAVFQDSSPTSRAFVAVRPPGHHCSADHPSGFCWLNNVHVGIEYAAQTYGLTHAAILDFDLHHGDGSQAIAWQRNSKNEQKRLMPKQYLRSKLGPDIGYYSIHDINSYPCEAGDDEKVQAASLCIENAHGQSIWNVHLQSWKTHADFWKLYEERYQVLLVKARAFLQSQSARIRAEGKILPKAAIFISAGFDASEWEGEGMQRHKVNVPTEFYARFTKDVVELAQEAGMDCDGRVISVLEGGYSDRALCSGVLSHLSGLCANPVKVSTRGVGSILGLSDHLSSLSINGAADGDNIAYDQSWWSPANLAALEMKVNPPPPPQPGKKVRVGPQATYATPTESFAYKVIDANKFARSISGTMREAPIPVRPPTPPVPEVDWIIATQELSQLLIPLDRPTKSCTPDELAGVRVKKDRQSAGPILTSNENAAPRQLRDRRAKGGVSTESTHSDDTETMRSVSRSSRRETISVLPSADEPGQPARRASRRLSAGSTLSASTPEVDVNAPPMPSLPSKPTSASTNRVTKPPTVPNPTGVQVKKMRVPAKPRKTPSSPSSDVPASVLNKPTAAVPEVANGPGAISNVTKQEIDSLSSGLKKVTLKMSSSKEEHDRKQKEKVDAERKARALKAAETRRVNAAAKKAAQEGRAPAPELKREPSTTKPPPVSTQQTTLNPPLTAGPPPLPTSRSEVKLPVDQYSSAGSQARTQHPPAPVPAQPVGVRSTAAPGSRDLLDGTSSHNVPAASALPQLYDATEPTNLPTYGGTHLAQSMMPAAHDPFVMPPPPTQPQPAAEHNFSPPGDLRATLQTPPPHISAHRLSDQNTATNSGTSTEVAGIKAHSSPLKSSPNASKLPTWSSTGPIPFASSAANPTISNSGTLLTSLEQSDLRPSADDGGVRRNGNNIGEPNNKSVHDVKLEGQAEKSVWDVPETPAK